MVCSCGARIVRLNVRCVYNPSPQRSQCAVRVGLKASSIVAVDDEPGVFCHLVIQPPARGVGFMGLPVHPLDARGLGRLVHTFDQQPPHTLAARGGVGEQVLQVTSQLDACGAAVEQEMREAQQLPITLGHQRKHGLVLVEETRPSGCGDFGCQGGVDLAAIEGVIASPEGFPGLEVGGLEGADEDGGWHDGLSKYSIYGHIQLLL